jgi:hypothetical protein
VKCIFLIRCNVKYWEIIADNLSKAGWSWGCVSAIDCNGRTIWIADAHRDNGKRFVARADEKLTAFYCPTPPTATGPGVAVACDPDRERDCDAQLSFLPPSEPSLTGRAFVAQRA